MLKNSEREGVLPCRACLSESSHGLQPLGDRRRKPSLSGDVAHEQTVLRGGVLTEKEGAQRQHTETETETEAGTETETETQTKTQTETQGTETDRQTDR